MVVACFKVDHRNRPQFLLYVHFTTTFFVVPSLIRTMFRPR